MCSDKVTEFRERLISLRTQKDVSANKMSLSIGQSKGYINKIENQKTTTYKVGFYRYKKDNILYNCYYFNSLFFI